VKYSTDRDAYREAMAHQLAATGGGPLGVSGFHRISFQATDTGPWERLLGGRGLSWEVDGSLLEVEDSRPAVSLRVSSLAAATEALKQRGMLAEPDGAVEVAYRGVPTGIVLRQGLMRSRLLVPAHRLSTAGSPACNGAARWPRSATTA
jgi:hypothetical protein